MEKIKAREQGQMNDSFIHKTTRGCIKISWKSLTHLRWEPAKRSRSTARHCAEGLIKAEPNRFCDLTEILTAILRCKMQCSGCAMGFSGRRWPCVSPMCSLSFGTGVHDGPVELIQNLSELTYKDLVALWLKDGELTFNTRGALPMAIPDVLHLNTLSFASAKVVWELYRQHWGLNMRCIWVWTSSRCEFCFWCN